MSTIADNSTNPPRIAIGYGPSQINITQQLSGGEIGGAILARTDVVDSTRAELDILAESIVTAFNTAHSNGVDLNGNAGTDFFDATGTTAATISMNITDTRLIAASSTTDPGVGNNENALAMAALQTDKTTVILNPGPPVISRSFNDQYGSIVSQVATRTNQATVSQETQAGLVSQIRQRSESVSGVNLDEEAANLIKFQQAYQAASQIITVSNTVFNSLINAF
ncbi:FlgK family flagellar hook-associated protein [Methylophaga sp. UBA4204]|uniref:FlgK family flagellar hook-associated protein n=1 Tax=Methylophaga sp. UBA4204 TaxID=1946892 RepID=UPI0039C959E6